MQASWDASARAATDVTITATVDSPNVSLAASPFGLGKYLRSREQLMGSHGPRFWRSGFVTSRERDAFYRDRLRPAAPPIA